MLDRARRVISILLAAFATLSVIRVIVAYATRPSRWSTRFAVAADADADALARVPRDNAPEATPLDARRARMLAAVRDGDSAAYAVHFSDDVVALTEAGRAIVGRVALEAAVARTFEAARVADAEIVTLERTSLNGAVLERGDYYVRFHSSGADVRREGRFTALWKYEMGEWRIVFEAVRAGNGADVVGG